MLASDKLGGAERLVEWAREDAANEKVFWSQIYTKLAPLDVKADVGGEIVFRTIYEK